MAVEARAATRALESEQGRTFALGGLVFTAGIGSMATEITAARLLAPYYGASTIVWANVIGIVLGSLALGYWLGGRIADRRPTRRTLGTIVLAGAAIVAAIPFVARPILDISVDGLDQVSAGAAIGSFFATIALFAPAVVLFGMVAPFAVRLWISDVRAAGEVAGKVFALSTAGSLLGTFLPALLTIPWLGTQRTMLLAAAVIAFGATLLLGPRAVVVAVAFAGLLAIPPGAVKAQPGTIAEHESRYQYVQVVAKRGAHYLYLNEGIAVHSIWRPNTVLTGGYWDTVLALPPLLGRPVTRVAILGNAGGTISRAFGVYYPQARIDGVELDPVVTAVARKYFGLDDNPNLEVYDEDARPFLRRTRNRYDLIVVDAYRPPYVPFYLATQEFFRLARERLRPGGIIAMSIATVPGDHRLADDVAGTLATEFPQVRSWQPLKFNKIVIGFTRPVAREVLSRRLVRAHPDLLGLTALLAAGMRTVRPSFDPWTDDRSPVEWITDRMIVHYAAEGGTLDEDYLPTRPSVEP
jgi:spermidine synthase